MATAVKICGVTRVEDGLAAAHAGAHAVGLVFHAASPRCVDVDRARQVAERLPPFVTVVGLFVDPRPDDVRHVLREVPLHLLQFHGDEAPDFCSAFSRPYIKAARIRPELDLLKYLSPHTAARAWMLDAFHEDLWGGTGGAFDWGLVPRDAAKPVILSGGLTADNVADAVRRVRPYAVDVSTGVEASKGIKDAAKIAAFIGAVKREDS